MTSEFDKFIDERRQLRRKYFEKDGYYKWSDIIDDANYKRRRDMCLIPSIIAGNHKNWDSDFTQIMNEHINDSKVNWNAIFNYLDETLKIVPDDELNLKKDINYLLNRLEPYKNTVLIVYTGF